MSRPSLVDVFVEHVGPSMAKQEALLAAVDGLPCHINLGQGEARFANRYTFQVQLLGIEDQDAGIWTWSWALPESTVAPRLVRSARALEKWGKENEYEVFSIPRFKTKSMRGDEIAILSCGLTESDSFLVADTELGTAYLLIPDLQGQLPTRHSAQFLASILPEILTNYTIPDHGKMVRSLLAFEGYDVDVTRADRWLARRDDGGQVTVIFDGQGRVARVTLEKL